MRFGHAIPSRYTELYILTHCSWFFAKWRVRAAARISLRLACAFHLPITPPSWQSKIITWFTIDSSSLISHDHSPQSLIIEVGSLFATVSLSSTTILAQLRFFDRREIVVSCYIFRWRTHASFICNFSKNCFIGSRRCANESEFEISAVWYYTRICVQAHVSFADMLINGIRLAAVLVPLKFSLFSLFATSIRLWLNIWVTEEACLGLPPSQRNILHPKSWCFSPPNQPISRIEAPL